jgi:hypothetical protein
MIGQRSAGDDDVPIVFGAAIIVLVVGLLGSMLV